jgi:hypothetical protein
MSQRLNPKELDVISYLNKLIIFLVSIFAVVFSGCATVDSIRNAPLSKGVQRSFNEDYDKVLKASRKSVIEAGLLIEEANRVNDKTWVIIGKKCISHGSYRELVRLVVEKTSDTETGVRVLTKRRYALDITAKGDYSQSILSNIDLKLKKD